MEEAVQWNSLRNTQVDLHRLALHLWANQIRCTIENVDCSKWQLRD